MVITENDITSYDWYLYPMDIDASKGKNNNYIPILVIETSLKSSFGESYIHINTTSFPWWGGSRPVAYSAYTDTNGSTLIKHYNGSSDTGFGRSAYFKFDSSDGKFSCAAYTKKGVPFAIYNWYINLTMPYNISYIGVAVHTSNDIYFLNGYSLIKEGSDPVLNVSSGMKGTFLVSDSFVLDNDDFYFSWDNLKDEAVREILKASKRKDPDDPYDGGDDPGDDDNTPGDYDHTSDPVPEPDLPSVSVTDSGLVTLFAPTESQLKSLANYLWSDAFSLDNFKKMLNNPMDCILGLTIVPVNVPRGSAREITVGNIVTTVSCDICPTQYVKVDCGTFTFNRHDMTNSYLDYSPYSKCYLYLPFIGVQEINIDDFMQSTMHVVYHVDILTGAMFCYVMRDSSVMYTYMGQCAENVPLSSSSYSNTIGSIMSAAASIVGVASMAATGGATAPVAAGLLAGATTSTANAVSSLKPSVAHSGSIGGGAGIMGVNYPYLIFNTPHVSIPSQQRHYTGYPSNQIVKLSALKGFNVIQAINLSVSGANDSEMNEIENILKGGVIL